MHWIRDRPHTVSHMKTEYRVHDRVVDVLYYIFLELYVAMPYLFDDIRLSSFFSGIGSFEKALKRLEETVNH